jgi:hypothetical protein
MESAKHLKPTVHPCRQFSDPAGIVQPLESTEKNRSDPNLIRKLSRMPKLGLKKRESLAS